MEQSAAIGTASTHPHPARRPVLLVVEDEPLIREMVADALEDGGFAVRTASNAAEALAILQSCVPVSLLFTDIDMPGGMDGYALAREARSLCPDLPVAYTSGARRLLNQGGAVEGSLFLAKPYRVGQLADLLGAVLP